MKIVIFEPNITGHRQEYVNHLIDYLCEEKLGDQYIFILHPDFEYDKKIPSNQGFIIQNISKLEHSSISVGNILNRSIRYYRLADKYAIEFGVNHLFFMSLIDVQFALGLYKPRYSVSGILYRVFLMQEPKSLRQKATWVLKFLQTWFFLRRKFVHEALILNDQQAVSYLNKSFSTDKFHVLLDPIPDWTEEPGCSIRSEFNIVEDRKILLHPGSLSERKGTIKILKAIDFIPDEVLSTFVLLIVGKPEPALESEISEQINISRKAKPIAKIIYHPEFISNSLMQSCFEQCDAILAPYSNQVLNYSGIIGHAFSVGKPVLSIKYGFLGRIIDEYGFGVLIGSTTPEEIAKGILLLLNTKLKLEPPDNFLLNHNRINFARKILDSHKGINH